MRQSEIIAIGGGGFTMEPGNPLLDQYILARAKTRSERPKVCFLPTASGDNDAYIRRFYETFSDYDCEPTYLSLFRLPPEGLEARIMAQDLIYVGGGNTVSLLALLRGWGMDRLLRRAWEEGILLAGLSSGSICWFRRGLTDSLAAGDFRPLDCLDFLSHSHCPHYDSEPRRQPLYRQMVQAGDLPAGYAVEDGVALRFAGDELVEAVSSRPRALAFHMEAGEDELRETVIQPVFLG